jgi:mono/diheme cytochrome c family protein
MRGAVTAAIAVLCLGASTLLGAAAGQAQPAAGAAAATPAGELVTRYCVGCHNERLKSGNLMLDRADPSHVGNSAETWEKVIIKLRTRAMPPPGGRRPDSATYDAVAAWLEQELDRAAAAKPNPGRPADLHRLNRIEYANAIYDLLGLAIDGPSLLPPDEQAYGFDTNADALAVTPALLDRYLTTATAIARLAVGDPTMPPAFERYTAVKNNSNERTWLWQADRLGEEFPLGSRGGITARHYFPVDGEYVFKLRLDRTWENAIRGLNVPNQIEIRVDGRQVAQFAIGAGAEGLAGTTVAAGGAEAKLSLYNADEALQVRLPLKAGLRQVTATILRADATKAEGLGPARMPIWSLQYDSTSGQLIISSLLIGGPYNSRVPRDSPSRRRIFVCQPAGAGDETACATKILSALARRAYRRPASIDDVQTLLRFYERGRAEGTFDTGIRAALERLLVSPDFLFRIEMPPAAVAPDTPYRLSEVELASRLSFFLWSSIPDDELLDLAVEGKLRDPQIFDRQVRRMLAAPRARAALVENFFGQWLQVRNMWLLTPDTNRRFPWFDDNLRTAFVRETEMFLDAQLKEDRGIGDLLTGKETFLNEQLARHYGVPNVYGSHFRRVTLTDENRWGLLGKGSVLSVTSYAHRTSPTLRGKWLLENILAAPVPPPPPDVNTNLEGDQPVKTTSVRQMLEAHRKNPVCASCHARMDPLGFSLENFDAIGQWRTTDAEVPIDPAGVLLDGTKVTGPAALRQALVGQQDQFVKAVTEKLLMYAVGRQMEYYDAPAIRSIVRAAAADGYRWSATIAAIVKSTPFQMRRSGS